MQQATRLHDEKPQEFRSVCFASTLAAREITVPQNNSFRAFLDNMTLAQKDKDAHWFRYVIKELQRIYDDAFRGPAEVIPFYEKKTIKLKPGHYRFRGYRGVYDIVKKHSRKWLVASRRNRQQVWVEPSLHDAVDTLNSEKW